MKATTKNKIHMKALKKVINEKNMIVGQKESKQDKIDVLKSSIKNCEADLENIFHGDHIVIENKIKLLKQRLTALENE